MSDPKAQSVLDHFNRLKQDRGVYDVAWQDIRELVRPNTVEFLRNTVPGQVRTEKAYDSTAIQSCQELGAWMYASLTPASERWMAIELEDMREYGDDPELIEWLELVTDALLHQYANDATDFNGAICESFLDIPAFGTCVFNQEWNWDENALCFKTQPLADCFFEENNYHRVDSLYRRLKMTTRQMLREFGLESLPLQVRDNKNATKQFDVIHAVHPRDERTQYKLDSANMPFASLWVCELSGTILRESGYSSFPYHVPRWTKIAGEPYGRGPGIQCLPDIKMVNRMMFVILKAGQLAIHPPLQVPSDGFLLPIKTHPGALLMKEPGTENIEPLKFEGNLPIGLEIVEQTREAIRRCFFVDVLKSLPAKKERQSAFEVSQMVDQNLRLMGAMLGRIQTEMLTPMIRRTYELLKQHDMMPPPPSHIRGAKMAIRYVSPAALAQRGAKLDQMSRFLNGLLPLAQMKPDVIDALNTDGWVRVLAEATHAPTAILNTAEEMETIRQRRAEEQLAMAAKEAIEPASKAAKNLAEAQQIGGLF